MTTDSKPGQLKYSQFYWIFFLLFPFMMQGFKPEEIAPNTPMSLPIEAQLVSDNKAIQLEVARTSSAIKTGLAFRDSIPDDRGILYAIDSTSQTSFTGKDNKFATELLFFKGERVAYIQQVEPCSDEKCLNYRTNQPYDRVIEVKAGISNQLKMSIGSKVDIRFLPKH